MPFVKFRTSRQAGADTFETGNTYELPAASAHRWVRRHAAVFVVPEKPKAPATKQAKKKQKAKKKTSKTVKADAV